MVPRRSVATLAESFWTIRRLSVLGGHLSPGSAPLDHTVWESSAKKTNEKGRTGSDNFFPRVAAGVASAATAAALSTSSDLQPNATQCEAAKPTALNPKEFVAFKLKHVEVLNHNTKVFRFELQPGQTLGLTVASCLVTKAPIGPPNDAGKPKPVFRPYTPITQPGVEGYFDLLIKVYPNGTMSRHIDSLKPGDTLDVKGPIPKLAYTPNMKKHIGMVAGGTGITPMLQVVDAILSNPEDDTQVSLVFANTTPADVLLKEQLQDYSAGHPNFKVFFVVDKADPKKDGWKGGIGFVTADMLSKALPPPSEDSLVLVCGPPGMMKHVSGNKAPDKSQGEVEGLLKALGYSKEQVYKF